jgi:hypothetical protein
MLSPTSPNRASQKIWIFSSMIDIDIPVRYISAADLIKNKLALGRHRDLADVEAIRESEAANAGQPKDN